MKNSFLPPGVIAARLLKKNHISTLGAGTAGASARANS
jgi:hypothetical protein